MGILKKKSHVVVLGKVSSRFIFTIDHLIFPIYSTSPQLFHFYNEETTTCLANFQTTGWWVKWDMRRIWKMSDSEHCENWTLDTCLLQRTESFPGWSTCPGGHCSGPLTFILTLSPHNGHRYDYPSFTGKKIGLREGNLPTATMLGSRGT